MISFNCPCGKPFRFSPKFRGRQFRCNACGESLVVPDEPQFPATPDEHEEDEIIISDLLPKAREKNVFPIDLDENESTSTILSKAVIAQQLKAEQEQAEAAQAPEAAPESKPAKKGGLLTGLFKKKPKTTDAAAKPVPAPKTKEKPAKAPKAPKTPASKEEKPKKAGFLSGLFKKKPKTTDAADGEKAKPVPAPKASKAPAPKKEKVKKAGFFSGLFKKKPKAPKTADATESD